LIINILYWISSVGFVCLRWCSLRGYAEGEGMRPTATTGGRYAERQEILQRAEQIDQHHHHTTSKAEQLSRAKSKSQNIHRKQPEQQPPTQKKIVFLTHTLSVKGSSTLNP